MVKNITTLVKDIYELLSEEKVEIDATKLAEMIKNRLSEKKDAPTLRMSNFGTSCNRKLWYSINKPELAEPLNPWTRLTFLIGDIIEEVVLSLVEQTGHKIEGRQEELEIGGIKGHRDAIIDGLTVDVKSANSRSFEKFKQHKVEENDPFGYIDQLSLYIEAGRGDPRVSIKGEGAFLAVDKELGHLVLDKYKKKNEDYENEIVKKKAMVDTKYPPDRIKGGTVPDGKSGNEKLTVPCSYCNFKNTCYPGLRTFLYSSGPRFLTKVVVEPEVPELNK